MGIIQIEKESKGTVVPASSGKKENVISGNDSLSLLNNSSDGYAYDFGAERENLSSGMTEKGIKKEVGIVSICIYTFLRSVLLSLFHLFLFGGIVYALLSFTGWIEPVKDFLLLVIHKIGKEVITYLLSFLFLFLVCLVVKGNINGSIRKKFRTYYLSKVNIYIYDVFVVVFNLIFYVGVSFFFFWYVNHYQEVFRWLYQIHFMNTYQIEISHFSYFKYIIAILVSLFMSLNSIKDIGINHKQNQFVFEEEI